jgi:hypothetical protein
MGCLQADVHVSSVERCSKQGTQNLNQTTFIEGCSSKHCSDYVILHVIYTQASIAWVIVKVLPIVDWRHGNRSMSVSELACDGGTQASSK